MRSETRSVQARIGRVLAGWSLPDLPAALGGAGKHLDIEAIELIAKRKLSDDSRDRSGIQIAISDWLYDLVRANIKRGHAFDLDEVLVTRLADCFGYSRLFSALGERFGLDIGLVEVLIDNAGRYVPHHVALLNVADGTRRFLDAWYGSRNINHRRIGALVNGKTRDIDMDELDGHDLKGLPDRAVQAIVLYIKGNRSLGREKLDEAIRYYSRAVKLYPNNSRAFYNRALAHEVKGELKEAELDYARALRDEASLIRVMATTCELEELIKLDEKGIGEKEQGIYLWNKGFKTGVSAGYEEIGREYGLSPDEVAIIVDRVERLCTA